jgi:hypothetical protein
MGCSVQMLHITCLQYAALMLYIDLCTVCCMYVVNIVQFWHSCKLCLEYIEQYLITYVYWVSALRFFYKYIVLRFGIYSIFLLYLVPDIPGSLLS